MNNQIEVNKIEGKNRFNAIYYLFPKSNACYLKAWRMNEKKWHRINVNNKQKLIMGFPILSSIERLKEIAGARDNFYVNVR